MSYDLPHRFFLTQVIALVERSLALIFKSKFDKNHCSNSIFFACSVRLHTCIHAPDTTLYNTQ